MLEIMNTQTLEVSHALGSSLLLSSSIVPMDETGMKMVSSTMIVAHST
ncbi:hypothetical protein NC653_037298 [Populus alba x Populus x berolinensis]|uniref:Uncharacterized protein n=1 Tax=Populus alba x Populus x berolinensis TaxID=444605 RepID=A0AAD6PRT8_9ROSI|nr:hypothetical protein NC653_037298 [Populus alba x Populus x berolinensis]